MGKILDTITVFFTGNTDDLKKKKKEAEDLSADAAKNIKATKASTDAVNSSVQTTNTNLVVTEELTNAIGAGIAGWEKSLHGSAEALNEFIASEKSRREIEKADKALKATKKGANEVEAALKGVVSQFAKAALGAFTISKAIDLVKDVVADTTNLALESRNLDFPIEKLNALSRAVIKVGGSSADVISTFKNLQKQGGQTGDNLLQNFTQVVTYARQLAKLPGGLPSARRLLEERGFAEKLVDYLLTAKDALKEINDLEKEDSGIAKTKDQVIGLKDAWSDVATIVRSIDIDIQNRFLPHITQALGVVSRFLKTAHESSLSAGALGLYASIGATLLKGTGNFYHRDKSISPLEGTPFSDQGKHGLYDNISLQKFAYGSLPLRNSETVASNRSIVIQEININAPNAVNAQDLSIDIESKLSAQLSHLQNYYNSPNIG